MRKSAPWNYRISRGGSWYSVPLSAGAADHYYGDPGHRISDLGVRLVRRAL